MLTYKDYKIWEVSKNSLRNIKIILPAAVIDECFCGCLLIQSQNVLVCCKQTLLLSKDKILIYITLGTPNMLNVLRILYLIIFKSQ